MKATFTTTTTFRGSLAGNNPLGSKLLEVVVHRSLQRLQRLQNLTG